MNKIAENFKNIVDSMSYRPSDITMSLWIKRFLWSVCFVAFFYAYYIHSYNGMAMLMAMSGIWVLNNVITRRKIMLYLDIACVTVSLCIVNTLFLSGELGFIGPFMSLIVALVSIFILGLLWGNILGVFNCVFICFALGFESFTWIREIYSESFCIHFPYIMISFFAVAVFLEYGIVLHVLSKRNYREHLEDLIEEGKQERRKISINMLVAMYKALCTKSPEVGKHCERVADLSRMIAGKAGLTGRDFRRLYYAGLLHDIGKIGSVNKNFYWDTPDLSAHDRAEYIRHIDIGYQIVYKLDLQEISDATLYHHEHFDGTGEKGLKGEDIPMAARIVTMANILAHIENETDDYEVIIEKIGEQAGKTVDPALADIAIQIVKQIILEKEEEAVFGKVE